MTSTEIFLEGALYAIVVFDEYDAFGKKLIELVPRSWIKIDEDDQCFCQYPPIKLAQAYLTKWLKELKEPDEKWATHSIEIKFRANNYKQGLRRLQRAFENAQAASEPEDIYHPALRDNMLHEEIKALLNESSSLKSIEKSLDSRSIEVPQNPNNTGNDDQIHEKSSLKRTAVDATLSTEETESRAKKTRIGTDDKLVELKNQMTPQQKILAEYIDLKCAALEKKINNAKRSILYDISKKNRQLHHPSNTMLSETQPTEPTNDTWRAKIDIEFPIEEPTVFESFDEDLKINVEKQNALKTVFRVWTVGSNEYHKDINIIIAEMLKKKVQLLYSGAGRITKGVGKKNFSITGTYLLIKEFVQNKYMNHKDKMNILSVVSKYLAGAGDRDGGRLRR